MLPYLKSATPAGKKQLVAFRGINWSDQYQDGDLKDSKNLSARRFPYMSTRRSRGRLERYSSATAMTARGALVVVQTIDDQTANLLYDGVVVGQVTPGEKQFAVVNTKMVIWPDKVYLDLNSRMVKRLDALIRVHSGEFTTDTLTFKTYNGDDMTAMFAAGDVVTVSGCESIPANNKDIRIKGITKEEWDEDVNGTPRHVIKCVVSVDENGFTAGTEAAFSGFVIERKIPDMDFICESENRLWGCSSKAQTIYASSLGDPTNFFVKENVATDSYALAVGTEGDFTGCCKLGSAVLFWKEAQMHKMLGSFPAEYSMYTYAIEGLQAGCHKSMQIINEVLYYMGLHGVYTYTGGMPSIISANFGDKLLTDAVAGTDGDSYYLSVRDGDKHHLLVYETKSGLWVREDDTKVIDFGRVGKDLYFLDSGGNIWLADTLEYGVGLDWMAQFCPFYETVEGRKRYTKLLMRLELPKGAWMKAEIRWDGGVWRECGKIVGRDSDTIPMQIPINRCDCFELRLSGNGPCTIRTIQLEYQIGSDV